MREVREETGLEVDLERLVGVYVKTRETDLVLVFAATIAGGELRASDEREEARFFSTDSFPLS